ncbi:bacterial low temperature requirement A protein-domain-containing protein [Aspergillus varians]
MLPLLQTPLTKEGAPRGDQVDGMVELGTHDETLFDNPQFEHYEATSNIQLFFDLFFVGNLSSFTIAHEINSRESLESYVGFVCVLWFTWCQVTLYDVRFATDSIFERVAHACHFGVMAGFTVVSPNFLKEDGWGPLQQLSLLLMASRLTLLAQYGTTLFFTWRYEKTRTPLIIVMMSLAAAAMVYLGLSFAFYHRVHWNSYVAWYILAVMEVVVNVSVASLWPALSLWKTHLVERMTCLTLIILGEGILGLTKIISKIMKLDEKLAAADIGMLISAVLLIYFFYQLYFDAVRLETLGSHRQHLFAILHFPFHLALCLVMEGINQTFLWAHIVADIRSLIYPLLYALEDGTATITQLQTMLSVMFDDVYGRFETTNVAYEEAYTSLNATLSLPPDADPIEFLETSLSAIMKSAQTIVENFGWEIPREIEGEGAEVFEEILNAVVRVFNLTFGYFAISTGLVLIFISTFLLLSSDHRKAISRLRYICTGVTVFVGIAIVLLSIMTVTGAAENLGETPWCLPALMLIILGLLVLNHTPRELAH